ncbi:MAG: hypothetical protein PHE83_01005 [Opitutaceae bacterium]|nr:hypothetical protein [Opitutaceae bacterium]
MKIAIILCSIGAIASAMIGGVLLLPNEAELRFHLAHGTLERLAFKTNGTDELKKAVTDARAANKDLYITRSLAQRAVWVSVAFSGATLLFGVLGTKNKNQASAKSSSERLTD